MRDTEEAQFDDFVRARSTALLRIAFLLTGHRHTAEDLVQEVLERGSARPPARDNEVRQIIYDIATADLPPPTAQFGGSIAPSSPLAVRLRLPGAQGVIVAAEKATLRYRSGDGPWRPVRGYVALLPDSATAVQVSRPGQPTATVDLA